MEQRAPMERKVRVIPRSFDREGEAFRSISTSTGRIRGKRLAEMLGTLFSTPRRRSQLPPPLPSFLKSPHSAAAPFKISTLSLRSFEGEEWDNGEGFNRIDSSPSRWESWLKTPGTGNGPRSSTLSHARACWLGGIKISSNYSAITCSTFITGPAPGRDSPKNMEMFHPARRTFPF